VKGVVGSEQGAEASTRIMGLAPTLLGELDAVIGDGLVDIAVLYEVG
jgi:hypothetical protein